MEAIKKSKQGMEDMARDLRSRLQMDAQGQFVGKVQKWEKCTWDEAVDLCSGKSPERHPEYILGYRMADPLLLKAMYAQISRKAMKEAKAHFRETLPPDCQELFDKECDSIGAAWRKEYKAKGGK